MNPSCLRERGEKKDVGEKKDGSVSRAWQDDRETEQTQRRSSSVKVIQTRMHTKACNPHLCYLSSLFMGQ